MLLLKNLRVIGQISTTQNSQTTLKPNLAWIFLSVRANWNVNVCPGTPCIPLIGWFYFDSLPLLFWFNLFLEARAEILTKISLVFWSIWRCQRTFRNYLAFKVNNKI
jgi:hypothetical protein